MTDTIASRVTRAISGSVHALLDAVENAAPETMMTQAMREIDHIIDEVRAELGRLEAAKHLVTTQLNKLNTQNEELAGQIELALGQGREDLVRAGLEKQLNIEDQIPILQKSLTEQLEKAKELAGYIVALLAKKREMEEALREYLASRAGTVSPRAQAGGADTVQGRVADASAAFERVLAKETGVAGLMPSGGADAAKLRELQDLQRAHRIEERLAQLKAAKEARR